MIEVSKEQRERLIREVGRWYSAFRELGAVPFEQDLDAIRRLIESAGVKHSGEQPAPLPKEVEEAMKTVGGHFGGADFDPAIFGTDDGGPIDAAREKLQRAFAVIKAALEKPAPPAGTTDGTLTFKMPQATTVTLTIKQGLTVPAGEEER